MLSSGVELSNDPSFGCLFEDDSEEVRYWKTACESALVKNILAHGVDLVLRIRNTIPLAQTRVKAAG